MMGEAKRRRDASEEPPKRDRLDLLDEMVRLGEMHVHKILIERGEPMLNPMYHLATPDGHVIIPVGGLSKELTAILIKAKSRELRATHGMFIAEAWMVHRQAATPWHRDRQIERVVRDGGASQQPDRIEVVQLVATDGRRKVGHMWQMVRDNPGGRLISLVKLPDDGAEIMGRMIDDLIELPHA